MNSIHTWCADHDLILNVTKTKDVVSIPTPISINDSVVQQVSEYKYLGTTISDKVKFSANTERLVRNARRKLYIVRKLRFMGTSEQLAVTCYKTFIEYSLLHHASLIYNHLRANEKADMDRIMKVASKLSNTTLPNLRDTIAKRISTKALRMVTTNRHPVLSFTQLPSGRYRNLRSRINRRANCFRFVAICILF